MKNKFQSFEDGMRMAGGSIQHPLSIHSASIGTCRRHRVWQVLMTLVFLFTLSIGQMWADDCTTLVSFATSQHYTSNPRKVYGYTSTEMTDASRIELTCDNSNTKGQNSGVEIRLDYGKYLQIPSQTSVTSVTLDYKFYNSGSTQRTCSLKVEVGTTAMQVEISGKNSDGYKTAEFTFSPAATGEIKITHLGSGSSNLNLYLDNIEFCTASGGETPVCPSGLSISSKNDQVAFTEGDPIELTASLTAGNGDISYQWYKGGTAEGNKLTGKTAAKLEIASCTTSDAGDYYCVASKTSCSDAVNASAFAITVAADPKCFNMPLITSKPSDLAHVTVTGGTLTDANAASKAIEFETKGLKLGGSAARLKVTLSSASIVENTKITVTYECTSDKGSGIAIYNGDYAHKTMDESVSGKESGSWAHTFTAEEAANYSDEFMIDRNGGGGTMIVRAITVEDCGAAVTKHTVTLNYNDGETPAGSLTVVDGNAAVKPADPTRGKYTFLGWFVGDTDDEYVWSTAVTGDITLKAHWQDPWMITFNSDGGSEVAGITVKHNTKAEKPDDPTYAGHDFDGWYYGEPEVAFDWDANVTQNYALKAHWIAEVAKYDIEYYDGETKIGTEPQVWATGHPTAAGINTTKPLYTFVGWYLTSALEGDPVNLNTVTPVEGLKLYGKWAKAYATSVDLKAAATGSDEYTTVLDAHNIAYELTNTSWDDGTDIYNGLKIKGVNSYIKFNLKKGQLLILTVGYATNDVKIEVNDVDQSFVSSTTALSYFNYYAETADVVITVTKTANQGTASSIRSITIRAPYQVSFDANGGDVVAPQLAIPSVTLPNATNGTQSFAGWYTDADVFVGMNGESYTPTADITLVAHWETISTVNTLSDLKVDGVTIDGFDPATDIYYLVYEYGQQPVITSATATSNLAEVTINNTPVDEGTYKYVQVKVVPESGEADQKFYQVRYTNKLKRGVSIIKATVSGGDQSTGFEATGYYGGTGYAKLANNKKMNTNNYVGVKLAAGKTFSTGDVLFVATVSPSTSGGSQIEIYAESAGTNLIWNTEQIDLTDGIALPAAFNGLDEFYIVRKASEGAQAWNGLVDYVEVQHYMDPFIDEFKIGEAVGTIDQVNKTIAVEVPYGTDVTALTPVIAAYANGGATLDKDGAQDFTNPVSYQVSSAYTEDAPVVYTVTVTVADHYEAQIGSTKYTYVTDAFAAVADGQTIQLLDDCSYSAAWNLDGDALTGTKTVTLDLNGNDLTYTGTKRGVQVSNGAKLILMDGTAAGPVDAHPTIDLTTSPMARTAISYTSGVFDSKDGMCALAGSEIVINSGTYLATEGVILVKGPAATATVNDGVLICRDNSVIGGNGTNSADFRNYVMNIHGGILYGEIFSTGYASMVVYHPNVGELNIDGGILVSTNGPCVVTRGGETNITGGTLVALGSGSGKCGDASLVLPAVGIAVDFKSAYPGVASTNVGIGGTVDVTGAAGAVQAVYKAAEPTAAEVNAVGISGGQFSSALTQEVCAEGFAPSPVDPLTGKYGVIDQRIYIFNGITSSSSMATSPSGAISWAKVGDTMGEASKGGTYDEVDYVKALQLKNSSATKHFKIDVDINNNAKIEVIGMSNDNSDTRHAWLTNSTEKGDFADAIAGLTTTGYNPEMFATDWLEEGSYYLHADNTVNIFLIRVTPKAVDPKCEVPTITTQPATNLTFGAGNMTATVVAEVSDGGTLKYQWYNAANDEAVEGATSATLTTTTEGTYYVIVTNTLANHRDNSIKSEEATLAYRVLNDATLSALSYGTPATAIALEDGVYDYVVNLAKGTTDVPALAATATMHPYATVLINDAAEFVNYEAISTVKVTAEDGTTTKTYTVHFYVAHPVAALVDVTENTTWDWTAITARADGSEIDVPSGTKVYGPSVTTEDGLVLANYVLGGDNWDKIEGNNGAYAIRSSTMQYYQGASLHFHTTKGGIVVVDACNEGHTMKLKVENGGRVLDFGNLGSWKEYKFYAVAGDVVIYNESADGYPMRVRDITFTVKETPDYTRDQMLGAGVYGTICVPNNVPAGGILGITVYELMGREPQYGKLAFDEVTEMEAGVPYVFQAHGNELALFYGETSVANPVDKGNGMYGTFVDINLTDLNDVYYFAQRALWGCADLTSLSVPANRAYVKLSEIDYLPSNSAPAPGRRRITMTVNGQQVVTGIDNLNAGEQAVKLIIDGKMYILRGEKMYDATGRLVK